MHIIKNITSYKEINTRTKQQRQRKQARQMADEADEGKKKNTKTLKQNGNMMMNMWRNELFTGLVTKQVVNKEKHCDLRSPTALVSLNDHKLTVRHATVDVGDEQLCNAVEWVKADSV